MSEERKTFKVKILFQGTYSNGDSDFDTIFSKVFSIYILESGILEIVWKNPDKSIGFAPGTWLRYEMEEEKEAEEK